MPLLGFTVVASLAITLIGVIVLRSPDTHSNLWQSVRADYGRTPLGFIGQEAGDVELALNGRELKQENTGLVSSVYAMGIAGAADLAGATDPGRVVYLTRGCSTCHGVDARGGPVAPSLAGSPPATVERMAREGPGGMPAYSPAHLSDDDMADLAPYLRSLEVARPKSEEIAALQRLTYDPSVPLDVLLKGKAAIRRSCGACHDQPGPQDIQRAFGSDAEAARLVADMVYETNLNLDDARAIAYYMLAVLNGADPVKAP
ncbi:MAG: cytochrome c [Chloroflexi bacterium]|nr:cytochrome c [Chloroflexota bacterium]